MLTDFQNSFTGRLNGKFATKSYLNIPPHLKRVATLPCEISMFKKNFENRLTFGEVMGKSLVSCFFETVYIRLLPVA